jgi:coenzyme F420 hydrogenase subunit beta
MEYKGLGRYIKAVSARAAGEDIRKHAQDGGTTTALVTYGFEKGLLDGAVLTKRSEPKWVPEPFIASNAAEAMKSTGTIYALSPNMYLLKDATRENGMEKVAYVGLPCQVDAVRKMQAYPFGARYVGDKVALVIGIFCTENFHPEGLRAVVEGFGHTTLDKMKKMSISKGKFILHEDKDTEVSVKKASGYRQDGDAVCPDLVAEYADISIGSIGSEPGWNTVFLRTEKGVRYFDSAVKDRKIETKDIAAVKPGLALLEKLSLAKKDAAKEEIEKRKKLGLFVTRDQYY